MFGVVGISYKSAPLEIREKFAFTNQEALQFLQQLRIDPDLQGAVVISTCNRIEVYFHFLQNSPSHCFDSVFRHLEYFCKTDASLRDYFYTRQAEECASHLFKVVSGLESMVLGEDQIVTQVKNGFKLSLEHDHSSAVLTRMFNKAFEAGKRVRTETVINKGSASVSSAAVELICSHIPDITQKNILLIGAGVMGELALVNLVKRNSQNLFVTNRTFQKALELQQKYAVQAFGMERLGEYLPQSDVVMVATGAQSHIITRPMVEAYAEKRTTKQVFMDLSVPRNISTDILQLPHVELYAVDDLKDILKETKNKRQEAVAEAQEIIDFVLKEFTDWLCALDLNPSIRKIQHNMEQVNTAELEGFLKINGVEDTEMVVRYAEHIARKYTRLFIRNLKDLSDNGRQRACVEMVNQLFEFQDNNEK